VNKKSWHEDKRILEKEIYPAWGNPCIETFYALREPVRKVIQRSVNLTNHLPQTVSLLLLSSESTTSVSYLQLLQIDNILNQIYSDI
jgi:hypothetical protein